MRISSLFLAVTLSLAVPQGALAQPRDIHAVAEELFRQGRKALESADYPLALRLFQKSQEMERGRGKLLNLAICEEKLGRFTDAARHLQEVLPQLAPDDERLPIARALLSTITPRLPRGQIDLAASSPAGTTVRVDGTVLTKTALGQALSLDLGSHTILVSAPGRLDRRYSLVAEDGKTVTLAVEAGAEVEAARAPAQPSAAGGQSPVAFVVGGVGLSGLAIGSVTGLLALGNHASAVEACPQKVGCSQAVVDQASAGRSLSIVSTVAFAAGGVGVGVGVVLLLLRPASNASSAPAKVGLTLRPGSLGIEGTF